jgi:phospholipase C
VTRALSSPAVAILVVLSGFVHAGCSSAAPNPAGAAQAWIAGSATDPAKNTHLWILDRAIDILSNHTADVADAANTLAWIRDDATCRANLEKGLFQADYMAPFNAGASDLPPQESPTTGCCCGVDTSSSTASTLEHDAYVFLDHSTWLSHFYDPTTGLDYAGYALSSDMPSGPSLSHPFLYEVRRAIEQAGGPVPVEARGSAIYRLGRAKSLLEGGDVVPDDSSEPADPRARGCFELGLALHYATDLTQPMHAANFAATNTPRMLHSNFEMYARSIQAGYVLSDWNQTPSSDVAPQDVLNQAAVVARAYWTNADGTDGPLKAAFNAAYQAASTWDATGSPTSSHACQAARLESAGVLGNISLDLSSCWQNNPAVAQQTGAALQDAEQSAAYFLTVLHLPTYASTGPAPAPPANALGDDAGAPSADDPDSGGEGGGDDGSAAGDDADDAGG